jgi:Cytosolic domain of 10TM putative phosphate transporter
LQRHAHLRTVLVEGIPNKLRSTATLATYFETLYPNAVLNVRLCQDLHTLDRLVDQRIEAVTALERSMYANHLGYKRPTVRVGNMAEEVDATRHYQQILNDLNAAIAKEQVSATARAQFVDRMSGVDTLSIIEGFLQVTEMGSLKKLLKKQSGSSQKWIPKNKPHKEGEDLLDVTKDEPNFEGLRERKKSTDGYGTYQSGESCVYDCTEHQSLHVV